MSTTAPALTSPVQVVNSQKPSVATPSMRSFPCREVLVLSLARRFGLDLGCAGRRMLCGDSLIEQDGCAFSLTCEVRQVTAVEATHMRRSGADPQ